MSLITGQVGAIVQEDLSEASTIVAVKEVPINLLLPNKTYMFFSHTIKAQPYNMLMLDAILAKVSPAGIAFTFSEHSFDRL